MNYSNEVYIWLGFLSVSCGVLSALQKAYKAKWHEKSRIEAVYLLLDSVGVSLIAAVVAFLAITANTGKTDLGLAGAAVASFWGSESLHWLKNKFSKGE